MDAATLIWSLFGAFWVANWAVWAFLAIRAVKDDSSWLAWDLEDQLPLIVVSLLFLWPALAYKVMLKKLR
jgi:hypothetical protein